MSSIGYATLSVIPSLRGLDRNVLAQLNGQAGRAGGDAGTRFGNEFSRNASRSTSKLGSHFKALAKGIGYVTLGALGAGAALGVLGVKSAASLEQTRTSFAALLGSQKAANAEISQLQKYAAKTPFSQQDIFGYAQQFFALAQSVGLSRNQLTPFLDAVGNLGAVTGASTEGIHNAVLAIAQIGSRGKVTLDNLNQLSQAFPGFNGAAAIASATGKTTAQVMTEINKGTLDAKTGINALLIGMQNFKGASGAMAKQSQTLNGLFSTFGDTVKIKLTNAFQKLVPVVKQELTTLTPVIGKTLQNLAPAIASFAKNLAPVLAPLTQGLGQALGAIFSVLGPVLKNLAPLIEPIAHAFVGLVRAAQPLIVFLSKVVAQLGPPLIRIFNSLVAAVEPVVRALARALAPVLPIIADSLKRVSVALRPVIAALSGAFLQVIQAIGPQLPELAKSLGDLAVAAAQLIASLAPLIKLFGALAGLLSKGVVKYLQLSVKWMTLEINAIKDLLGWVGKITGLGHAISSSISFVSNALSNVDVAVQKSGLVFDKLTGTFASVGGSAGGAANAMNVLKAAAGGIGAIAGPLSGAFNGVSSAIGAVSGNIRTLLHNAATALSVLGALGIPGISAAAGAAGALAAAANSINTGVQTGGGGGFTIPPGGGGGGGGGGGAGSGPGSKPPKPGKFDKGTLAALRKALSGDATGIRSAIQSIEQSLRQAKKAIPAYVAGEATQLEKWARQRTAVAAKLSQATAALQAVQGKFHSLLTSVRDATIGSFDITTAGAHAQVFNDRAAAPTTAGSILAALNRQVADAQSFDAVLRKLRGEGMPAELVQQLALAGPGALAQARALSKSTPAQIAKFRSQYKALRSTGTDLGKFLAKDAFGAGVKAAQGLVDGLRSKKSLLTKEIEKLGQALIDQLKKTLKISSPSRVMFELGGHTAEGFRLGIASGYAGVNRAGAGLGNNAAAAKFGRPNGSIVHNHEWNITQQEDPIGTATAVIRRMQFLGV